MVQDPNFWRRFSVAVHNDEAAMLALETGTDKKEVKHAYVVSLSSPLDSPLADSPITTPTSQCHLSPAFPPLAFTRPLSAPAFAFAPAQEKARTASERTSRASSKTVYFDASSHGTPEMVALHALPSHPRSVAASTPTPSLPPTPRSAHFALDTAPSKRASRRASRFRFALSSHPPSLPASPKSTTFPSASASNSKRTSRRLSRHPNGSRLSLGISLSGRPRSNFRFWTTVTAGNGNGSADVTHSDGWLESQNRKARQRTWMCWSFWMVFIVVVVAVIVTVLVLRGKGII